jgi:Uncharacterised nucleotidyltransferase
LKLQAETGTEQKLLLALLGCQREVRDRAGLVSLLREVNWPSFLAITSQDLYPYLAFRLEPYMEEVEAPPEWELLFRARRLTAVHNLGMCYELRKVIEGLQECDVTALVLKGIILAYTTYPDPSLRPMSDLDLLVPPEKKEKALLVLRKLGFEYPESVFAIHRDHISRLIPEQEYEPPLRLRDSAILLEVHSQLECGEPFLPIPAQEFWSRSVTVDLNGLRVRTLCPEDFLLHLCLHQSRSHRFEKGLLPLIDLRLLVDSRKDWSWPGIAARSLRYGCATWMYLTLKAACELAGAQVSDSFFQAVPVPRDFSRLQCLVEEQIWSARSQRLTLPLVSTLLAEPSWQGRARMLFARMRLVRREEVGSELTLAGLIQRARLLHRRLLATFRTRIPQYLRAWRNGQLKPDAIRRAAQLFRNANTLFRLVVEQETGLVGDKDRVDQKQRGSGLKPEEEYSQFET